MPRFLTALVAVCILVLGSTTASAQDQPMPGRGEILELRRDDPRNTDGYRSFIFRRSRETLIGERHIRVRVRRGSRFRCLVSTRSS